jgi:serine protease inhibitor
MGITRSIAILALGLFLTSGCSGMSAPEPTTNPPPAVNSVEPDTTGPAPAPTAPTPVQPATEFTQTIDVSALAPAYNRFGLGLFRSVAAPTPTKNVFVSPLSVAFALAMAYNGAYAETATDMADVLQVGGINLAAFNAANEELRTALTSDDADALMAIANSLWVAESITFRDAFMAATRSAYAAELASVDFLASGTAERINTWVELATRDKITNLVKKDDLTDETLAILINAVYFKGLWETQFDKTRTQDKAFNLCDGTAIQHPLMWQHDSFAYLETPSLQAVWLPYRGGALRMQVFLPAEDVDMSVFLTELTPENWQQWQNQFRQKSGTVMLPRFKSEYECELKEALSLLGMGIAFDREAGDFRCMAECRERIVIDKVRHKAFVEVNEEGTEAAAATSISMVRVTSAMPEEPFTMIVDRPFFYAITDVRNGVIVFAGIMNDPR